MAEFVYLNGARAGGVGVASRACSTTPYRRRLAPTILARLRLHSRSLSPRSPNLHTSTPPPQQQSQINITTPPPRTSRPRLDEHGRRRAGYVPQRLPRIPRRSITCVRNVVGVRACGRGGHRHRTLARALARPTTVDSAGPPRCAALAPRALHHSAGTPAAKHPTRTRRGRGGGASQAGAPCRGPERSRHVRLPRHARSIRLAKV